MDFRFIFLLQLPLMQTTNWKEKPDVLMLGPQVRYLESQFKRDLDIPVSVINMQDYGLMNGEKALKASLKAIDDSKGAEA